LLQALTGLLVIYGGSGEAYGRVAAVKDCF